MQIFKELNKFNACLKLLYSENCKSIGFTLCIVVLIFSINFGNDDNCEFGF